MKLFLTPSAVSHQMKELEEALGVRLFERKTRALELTTAGTRCATKSRPSRCARSQPRTVHAQESPQKPARDAAAVLRERAVRAATRDIL